MSRYINVHCHLINLQFIPNTFFKIRAPIRERLLKRPLTRWLARIATKVMPGKNYDRLHEALDIFNLDIDKVAKVLVDEMDASHIKLAIPLMMDLEHSSYHTKPEIPYRHQIELVSRIALEYPGKIMSFVMVDPRRPNAAKITIKALEKLGFLGIKMYPPLGYHPYFKSFYNEDSVNDELEQIYAYCEQNKVPITVHCSKGGAYGSDIMNYPELRKELTKPSNWRNVLLEFPKLYLNFAHFGGDFLDISKDASWSLTIKKLMEEFENVCTDIAYHDQALQKKTSNNYFDILKKLLNSRSKIKSRILFGTDWSMTRHTWTEKEYISYFSRNLNSKQMNQIALINPLRFLFPTDRIPKRIETFYKNNEKVVPNWLINDIEKYLSA